MKKALLCGIFALFAWATASAQVLYESFEPQNFTWPVLNGTMDQVVEAVANPDATGVNTSATVGKMVNNPASDFTFALGSTPTPPINLSVFSQIKMKVWSPVAGHQVLFKIEGGGKAVEEFKTIPVANQWVELSFNLNCGVDHPALDKILLAFNPFTTVDPGLTYYFDDIRGVLPGDEKENFEGAPQLTWEGLGSTFTPSVANPAANVVNGSATVGQFDRNMAEQWTSARAILAAPLDLSTNNQFVLKVHAPSASEILFKLEGGGDAIEKRANIATAGNWREYTFDMSAKAAATTLNSIVIFFAPGTNTDGTYYFDDLRIVPKSCACKNAMAEPILDDFECNRNASYANGWDSLSVVPNPQVNGDNPSKFVGKYVDPVAEAWAVLLTDNENPIDLSVKNQMHAKIWSPKTGQHLFKLEGGASPAKEVWVTVTEPNKWVEYVVDFSTEAIASHKKFGIFFNASVDAVAGDVYFIDDLFWGEKTNTVLEDFEAGAFLPWEPLDGNNILNGLFAVVANPAAGGVNTSSMVGKYTKGSSNFSTVASVSPSIIDISVKPQYNLDVWAPTGSVNVTMQLESITQGNKEVTRNLKTPGAWETVNFDFSDYQAITDWASLRLIFDPGTSGPLTMYFFDNLTQGPATVDPCENVVPVPNIVDDFECQRNYDYGAGAAALSVVTNPAIQPANQSSKAGKYVDPANDPFAALGIEFPAGIDLTTYNQFELLIKAPAAGLPVVFKLEGGTSPGFESAKYTTVGTDWVKVSTDFSALAGGDYKRMVIFFNFAEQGASADWFIDNLAWKRAAYTGCIDDHETAATTISNFKYFANGYLEATYPFKVLPNPNKNANNPSNTVGEFVKAKDALSFAGMYADLESPMDFKTNKTARIRVHMDHIGNVALKLEGSQATPPAANIELFVPNTKVNDWEELTIDFSAVSDDAKYARLTLFFDFLVDATGSDVTSYFDDIVIGDGKCQDIVGAFEPLDLQPLAISPNPVSDELFVKNLDKIARLDVMNTLGQRVSTVSTAGAENAQLLVGSFQTGVYQLVGFDQNGTPVARGRFVKQ